MRKPDLRAPRPQPLARRSRASAAAARSSRLRAVLRPAALLATLIALAHCSVAPPDASAHQAAPVNYGPLIANALKAFRGFAEYGDFQISGPRWVHALTGWSWLVCVRYDDHGHRRFYAFFIDDNSIVNARYDILMDQCGAQQYVPFDATTGAIGSPTPVLQQPIY